MRNAGARLRREWFLRVFLALLSLVLMVAGVLKAFGQWQYGDTLAGSTTLLLLVVAVEMLVAVYLIADRRIHRARCIALVFFALLAIVALHEAITGKASCACFGPLRISPWFTLAFDLSAVAAMASLSRSASATVRSAGRTPWRSGWRPAIPVALLLSAVLAATQGMVSARHSGDTVVLEPDTWVGRRLPILDQIDIGDELSRGEWVLLLFQHECPLCHRELPRYAELARRWRVTGAPGRVAAIEVPPFADSVSLAANPSELWHGRLSEQETWFVTTPTVIWLVDGRVEDVQSGKADDPLM